MTASFHFSSELPGLRLLATMILILVASFDAYSADSLDYSTASGGVTIGTACTSCTANLGNINGLGAGAPGAGVTLISAFSASTVLYYTPYNINTSGSTADVTAYVDNIFSHSAILTVYSCLSGCGASGNWSAMSTSPSARTTIVPVAPNPGTVTAWVGILVSNANGASAFTGSDSASVKFRLGSATATLTLSAFMQQAVRLLLSTAPGGLTISAGSDYYIDFGNVNGIGINPGAGLTVASVSGGTLYRTPMLLTPSFSSFSGTTATLKVYVSSDFAYPSILELRDSVTSGGTYNAISKNSGSQTSITTTASSTANVTRYLGLFVANTNGGSAFTGADTATLTYTLTAP